MNRARAKSLGDDARPVHSPSMELSRLILRVRSPQSLARFYVEHFGMYARQSTGGIILGFEGPSAEIEFRKSELDMPYLHTKDDRYWKIGITLPNVDIAYAQLRAAGVLASEPDQFGDIGYLCHLSDPEGFSIELLQQSFRGNRAVNAGDRHQHLGGGAGVGQISLRTADLDAALTFYRDRLGMTLLSIQPVPAYGFDLYFLAFTDDTPPNPDLKAVDNREWLWRRPYTTLELQHFPGRIAAFALPRNAACGFAGIKISGAEGAAAHLQDEAGGAVELAP